MSEISKTADKALAILLDLAQTGSTSPQRLAARMGVNRTVTQRLLTTLVQRGFVSRADGEYALAPRVGRLAAYVEPQLRQAARSHLNALSEQTKETVVLQVLDGDSAIVVDEIVRTSDVTLQARHEVGSRSRLDQTASGLAILASLVERDLARVIRDSTDFDGLAARVEQVRMAGVAQTSNELQEGVSGIAAPVRRGSGSGASIAVLAPSSRAEALASHAALLTAVASQIEAALHTS